MVPQAVFSTGLLSSYCREEEVLALLVGYDLARLGDEPVVAERLRQLLPLTKQSLDSMVGHDFFWHEDDTVTLDGNGRDRLSLLETGRVPVAAVHQVAVNGVTIPAEDYVVYPQRAEIQLRRGAGGVAGSLGGRFPMGQQNVTVTLDWGYPQVPADVTLAQAKLTAAQILAEAAGEKISAAEVRIGDYTVRYAAAGKYGAVIEGLAREAQALVRGYRRVGMRVV
jgi:hypothetical protein